MQKKKVVITGQILKSQAAKFWVALPQYQGQEQPNKFSNGWLWGFQQRYNIREYVYHGEAASAEIDKPEAIAQIELVRQLASEYSNDDILNLDETSEGNSITAVLQPCICGLNTDSLYSSTVYFSGSIRLRIQYNTAPRPYYHPV